MLEDHQIASDVSAGRITRDLKADSAKARSFTIRTGEPCPDGVVAPASSITEKRDAEHSAGKEIKLPSEYRPGHFLLAGGKDGPPLRGRGRPHYLVGPDVLAQRSSGWPTLSQHDHPAAYRFFRRQTAF